MKLTAVQRVELTSSIIGEGDILSSVLRADADKINRTLDEIDRASFERAVDKIIEAKNVYIIGVRSSAFLAGFLNHNLRMIFDNIKFIQTTSRSEMFEQIMNIGENDALIAISFPRYSKRVVNAVEFASKRGAEVIALTDSKLSPLAEYADDLLLAKSDMVAFVDTLAAPLSIINAIIMAIVRKKQDDISKKLCELEEIWDKYDVYDKN
jgi:DNA-binding MurR/RpiR family transcriptional regulator